MYWGKTGKQIDIHSIIKNSKEVKKHFFDTTPPEVSISEDQEIVNILPKQREQEKNKNQYCETTCSLLYWVKEEENTMCITAEQIDILSITYRQQYTEQDGGGGKEGRGFRKRTEKEGIRQ